MLVDQTITGIVPDKLNRDVQLILTPHTIAFSRHFGAAFNRVGPQKHRNTGFYRVVEGGHADKRNFITPFAGATVTPTDTDVAGKNRQHGNGPAGDFTVGMPLRPPALTDIGRFGATNFPAQLDNAIGGNAGYFGGPNRGFGGGIRALAQDIGLIMSVGRCAGG